MAGEALGFLNKVPTVAGVNGYMKEAGEEGREGFLAPNATLSKVQRKFQLESAACPQTKLKGF